MDIVTNLRKVRRQVASFSLATLIASFFAVSVAQAATFPDVSPSDWFYSYVEDLVSKGIVNASMASYRPGDNVNRAEMAKLVVEAFDMTLEDPTNATFKDVAKGQWYYTYVETAAKNGFVGGYKDANGTLTGYYGPADSVTREQAAKMIVLGAPLSTNTDCGPSFSDVPTSAWSYEYVESLYAWSVVDGLSDGSFGAARNINRAEVAKVVSNAMAPVLRDCGGPVVGDGDLSVELGASNPTGQTVPSGATSVAMAVWTFGAGSEDAVLKSLSVHKLGVSSLPGAHQVYLYDGNERLTAGKSVNSTTNIAEFNNLNLAIGAGDTITLTLRMDVGTVTTAGEVGFEIASATAVDADGGSVMGDFPVSGDLFDLSTTAAGTVTVTSNGDVSNPKVGENGATLSKFKLDAATEAAGVERIGIYLGAGTVSTADLANFELYVSGEDAPIATAEATNAKDVAVFIIEGPFESDSTDCLNSNGYCIEKGNSKTFTVKGDLNPARNDDTILSYIDETTDVYAVGDDYGFGMTVTIAGATGYDGTTCTAADESDCTRSVVEGGDVTITSPGPAAQDIGINGKDVVLQEFTIATAGAGTFQNFPLSLDMTETAATDGLMDSTTSNMTDIKIGCSKNGGAMETIWGPVDANVLTTALAGSTVITEAAGDDAESFYLFTEDLVYDAGDEFECQVTVDVRNLTTLADETIVASLELGTTYPEVKDINNKLLTNSTDLVPSANVVGKTMTIQSPSLTLSLGAIPVAGSTTQVQGKVDVKFVGISARCGTSSDCILKDITLTCDIDSDGGANAFTAGAHNSVNFNSITGSVWLEDNAGAVVAAAKTVQSTGAVNFTTINHTIAAGETKSLFVVGDISTNAFESSNAENLSCGINATTDLTFEDESGTSRNAATTLNASNEVYVTTSEGGSLTIAVDAATKKEDIIIAGSANQEVSKFKFTTTDEDFKVTKLSINARQNGVATANLGNYDNNIAGVKISYVNSLGQTETKSSTVVSGTAQFSGLDFWIAKDSDAVMTVSADVASLAVASQATAGEFIDLNIAFDSFEAIAQASGATYKGDKIDASVDAASDLDFGTPTWTTGSEVFELEGAQDVTLTLGSTLTLTIDNGSGNDNTNRLPVGALLCVDDNGGETCATEDIYVVTSWPQTAADASDTVTVRALDDAGDDAYDDEEILMYALPGTGYLTEANRLHVYESKPTLTVSSSSPSGARNVAATDNAFIFNIAANAQELVRIRAAVEENDTILDGLGTPCAISTDSTTGDHIDGTSAKCTLDSDAAGDSFVWDTTGTDLSAYARVNFWFQQEVVGGAVAQFADFNVVTSTAQATFQQVTAFSQTACGADAATTVSTEWYNCDLAMPTGTDSSDLFFGIEIDESTEIADTDIIYVDELKFYNDKLIIDLSTDTDVDTYANNTSNAAAPSAALLKEGGVTVATAYWDTLTNGASATTTAKATFIPTTAIDIAKGTSKAFTLTIDSADLFAEDAGSDDPVTFSIDLGTSVDGTVTAGDFWWHETNAQVQWLGQVTDTTVNSNTLIY